MQDLKTGSVYAPSGKAIKPIFKRFYCTFTEDETGFNLVTSGMQTADHLTPQTAIVDNTANTNNVILTVSGTNYTIPAGATFTIPLVTEEYPIISIVSAGGSGSTMITLTNVRMPTSQILPAAAPSSDDSTPSTSGPVTGALTDYSGSTTNAGESQQLMPAVTSRSFLQIQNIGSGDALWINFTADAKLDDPGSIEIPEGSTYTQDGSFVSNEAINILSGASGINFTAKAFEVA